jgi:predicted DNA-binding transcriptional regulator AlpA
LWRWLQAGKFVKPVYIGTRRYWRQSEIEKWLEQQSAAS